jgi:hypothetical protein
MLIRGDPFRNDVENVTGQHTVTTCFIGGPQNLHTSDSNFRTNLPLPNFMPGCLDMWFQST